MIWTVPEDESYRWGLLPDGKILVEHYIDGLTRDHIRWALMGISGLGYMCGSFSAIALDCPDDDHNHDGALEELGMIVAVAIKEAEPDQEGVAAVFTTMVPEQSYLSQHLRGVV